MRSLSRFSKNIKTHSHRPIALTSTICKLLERMIVNRLSWWLEERFLLSPWQAGFRKDRSRVDQCLRLSQHISDGFQSSRMTLFGFSKAYDRVWRTGLLQKMPLLGIPARFLVWTSSWMTNRQARVKVNAEVDDQELSKKASHKDQCCPPCSLSYMLMIS